MSNMVVHMTNRDRVECYAGYTYPQRPVAFWWQGRRLEVTTVRSEARLPSGRRFLVETANEQVFEINYNQIQDTWTVREVS